MDRIQFVNSINHNDKQLSEFIPKYIDQYMILYELVDRKDKVKYLSEYLSDNGVNQITFQILSTPESISTITRKLSTVHEAIPYGRVVHIDQIPVSNVITNISLTML